MDGTGLAASAGSLICKELGADIVYTEFVNAEGLIREDPDGPRRSFRKLRFLEAERPLGIQIYGAAGLSMEKAVEILRKRGIAKAEDRAGRAAEEGVIASYIHAGNKLGVMLEVNSETDFVARTDEFLAFSKDVSMHIAAAAPIAVNREDLDQELVEREQRIFKEQALQEGKPEKVVDRIVEGRMEKYFQDVCLKK